MIIKAMKDALEALEELDLYVHDVGPYITALRAAIAETEKQEPVAWMWQHGETGRIGFVEPWQIEFGFEKENPRSRLIAPLYRRPT